MPTSPPPDKGGDGDDSSAQGISVKEILALREKAAEKEKKNQTSSVVARTKPAKSAMPGGKKSEDTDNDSRQKVANYWQQKFHDESSDAAAKEDAKQSKQNSSEGVRRTAPVMAHLKSTAKSEEESDTKGSSPRGGGMRREGSVMDRWNPKDDTKKLSKKPSIRVTVSSEPTESTKGETVKTYTRKKAASQSAKPAPASIKEESPEVPKIKKFNFSASKNEEPVKPSTGSPGKVSLQNDEQKSASSSTGGVGGIYSVGKLKSTSPEKSPIGFPRKASSQNEEQNTTSTSTGGVGGLYGVGKLKSTTPKAEEPEKSPIGFPRKASSQNEEQKPTSTAPGGLFNVGKLKPTTPKAESSEKSPSEFPKKVPAQNEEQKPKYSFGKLKSTTPNNEEPKPVSPSNVGVGGVYNVGKFKSTTIKAEKPEKPTTGFPKKVSTQNEDKNLSSASTGGNGGLYSVGKLKSVTPQDNTESTKSSLSADASKEAPTPSKVDAVRKKFSSFPATDPVKSQQSADKSFASTADKPSIAKAKPTTSMPAANDVAKNLASIPSKSIAPDAQAKHATFIPEPRSVAPDAPSIHDRNEEEKEEIVADENTHAGNEPTQHKPDKAVESQNVSLDTSARKKMPRGKKSVNGIPMDFLTAENDARDEKRQLAETLAKDLNNDEKFKFLGNQAGNKQESQEVHAPVIIPAQSSNEDGKMKNNFASSGNGIRREPVTSLGATIVNEETPDVISNEVLQQEPLDEAEYEYEEILEEDSGLNEENDHEFPGEGSMVLDESNDKAYSEVYENTTEESAYPDVSDPAVPDNQNTEKKESLPGAYAHAGPGADLTREDSAVELLLASMGSIDEEIPQDRKLPGGFEQEEIAKESANRDGLPEAEVIDNAEKVYIAEDVKKDFWRQNLVRILCCWLVICIVLVATLVTLLGGDGDEDDDGLPEFCHFNPHQQSIPARCNCTNTTGDFYAGLGADARNVYEELKVFLMSNDVIGQDESINTDSCDPLNQVLLSAVNITLTSEEGVDFFRFLSDDRKLNVLTFIYMYITMNGLFWENQEDWLSSEICSWFGLRCAFIDVTEISLPGNGLTGTLPTYIGSFDSIRTLDLSENELSGTIPSEIGKLSYLHTLFLTELDLVGKIPSEITQLRALDELDLSHNELTGTIPNIFDLLSNLRFMNVRNNNLEGSLPSEIGLAKRLVELELGANKFTGTLPSEMENLTHLELLGLNNNTLEGTIPEFLGRMTHLRYLQLYDSGLTGAIPDTFCNETAAVNRIIVINCDQPPPPCNCCSKTDRNALVRLDCISEFPWLEEGN